MTERFPADDAPATDLDSADVNDAGLDDAAVTVAPAAVAVSAAPAAPLSRTARAGHWLRVAVAGVFGIVYAYYLWDAIRSLIELPAQYELMGLSRDDAPWSLLILGIILPIVTYVGALIVGRHRNVFAQALVLLTGLGALAALNLGVIALA
jgi:hypothetical protein